MIVGQHSAAEGADSEPGGGEGEGGEKDAGQRHDSCQA